LELALAGNNRLFYWRSRSDAEVDFILLFLVLSGPVYAQFKWGMQGVSIAYVTYNYATDKIVMKQNQPPAYSLICTISNPLMTLAGNIPASLRKHFLIGKMT